MDNPNGRGLLVAAVVAAGFVAVLGVLAAGPVQVGPPRWVPQVTPIARPLPTSSGNPPAGLDQGPGAGAEVFGIIFEILLILGAAAIVAALAGYLVRLWRARRRLLRRRGGRTDVGGGAGVRPGESVPAPVMQRGIARALALLDMPRAPSDAVVQAWLGLEDAAVQAGAERRPSETPAEYAARIIRRFETDRDAADTLLHLYQDVRFGGQSATAAAVADARGCLLRLQASWHDAAPAEGGELRAR
ncbi:hypothetical protein GCM10022240_22210 [Microbacterium kribbense]|uniref:Protein-glutamine gamma-glutamyltransferase-like C-terminal domain-containing protein n=1 Tax=Microbacterium kribbense TaxID=433645 RepID=A0ABP7GMR2_9MICO